MAEEVVWYSTVMKCGGGCGKDLLSKEETWNGNVLEMIYYRFRVGQVCEGNPRSASWFYTVYPESNYVRSSFDCKIDGKTVDILRASDEGTPILCLKCRGKPLNKKTI